MFVCGWVNFITALALLFLSGPGRWVRVHIIVSKRNVSKQLLSNQNHAEPVGDMLLKSRR